MLENSTGIPRGPRDRHQLPVQKGSTGVLGPVSLDHLPPRLNIPVTQSSLTPGPKAFGELGRLAFSETLKAGPGRGLGSPSALVCSPQVFVDEAKVQMLH